MGWHKIKSPHKLFIYKDLINLQVIPSGFEPETLCLEGRCSIQLSYETINLQIFGGANIRFLTNSVLLIYHF